jgi:hypothetical protein
MQFRNDQSNLDSAVVKTKHLYAVTRIMGKIGDILSTLLAANQPVQAAPRETCQALFESQGMLDPLPRVQMLDGFNEGWIDFEGGQAGTIKGKVELHTVLQELVDRAG